MSDRFRSIVRTLVPKLYGWAVGLLLAWLAVHAPWVIDLLASFGVDLNDPAVVLTVTGFVVWLVDSAWYAVLRWLEPRLPDWLTRALFGSAIAPTYAPVTPDGAYVITGREG